MAVVKFPTTLPSPEALELPRAQLTGILQALATTLLDNANALMVAQNAPEFAAAVHRTADKLAEAARGWSGLSNTVCDSWGIRKP